MTVPSSPGHKSVREGLDIQGGVEVVLKAIPPKNQKIDASRMSIAQTYRAPSMLEMEDGIHYPSSDGKENETRRAEYEALRTENARLRATLEHRPPGGSESHG